VAGRALVLRSLAPALRLADGVVFDNALALIDALADPKTGMSTS
jgi:hypothetical protein